MIFLFLKLFSIFIRQRNIYQDKERSNNRIHDSDENMNTKLTIRVENLHSDMKNGENFENKELKNK